MRTSRSRTGPRSFPSHASSAPQRLSPGRVDERSGRPQQRPRPTCRHPRVVDGLGVGAEPHSRIVRQQRPVLGDEQGAETIDRLVAHGLGGSRSLLMRQCARQLRRPVRRPCARLAQLLPDPPERLPASLDHLGLELGELPRDLGAVEDGDVVEYDLDPIGAPCDRGDLAPGTEPGHRLEVGAAAEQRRQQVEKGVRVPGRGRRAPRARSGRPPRAASAARGRPAARRAAGA